jgi:hypothetical protein
VLDETYEPFVTHRIEKCTQIAVQYVVHLRTGDPKSEGIQRIVLATPGPKSIREPQKIFLVDRIEYFDDSSLDDFILQRGNAERPLTSIFFADEFPSRRQRSISTAVYAPMQPYQVTF